MGLLISPTQMINEKSLFNRIVIITIKLNAKLIYLNLYFFPHIKLPNTCHKALQK